MRPDASHGEGCQRKFCCSTVAAQRFKAPAAAVELSRGGSGAGSASGRDAFLTFAITLVSGDASPSCNLTDLLVSCSGDGQRAASARLGSFQNERHKERPVAKPISIMC